MIKNEVLKIIADMEDNVSLDEIMYKLYIMEKHNKAMDDIESGRVYSTNDIKRSLGIS